jgi:hypothetical protein
VKNDRIHVLSTYECLKFKIRCLFDKTLKENTKVTLRKKIQELVVSLRDNISFPLQDEKTSDDIKTLFFDKMSLFSEKIFDRSIIKASKQVEQEAASKGQKTLYSFLLDEAQTEENKLKIGQIQEDKKDKSERLSRKMKTAILSLRLGLKPVCGGGWSGS